MLFTGASSSVCASTSEPGDGSEYWHVLVNEDGHANLHQTPPLPTPVVSSRSAALLPANGKGFERSHSWTCCKWPCQVQPQCLNFMMSRYTVLDNDGSALTELRCMKGLQICLCCHAMRFLTAYTFYSNKEIFLHALISNASDQIPSASLIDFSMLKTGKDWKQKSIIVTESPLHLYSEAIVHQDRSKWCDNTSLSYPSLDQLSFDSIRTLGSSTGISMPLGSTPTTSCPSWLKSVTLEESPCPTMNGMTTTAMVGGPVDIPPKTLPITWSWMEHSMPVTTA
ncbi:hypothetical protein BT96DRAFT_1002920 [Gymnopus androsaceus JB14]|uniref:Uncharacterized protein n=1 Tax=Gymnopus androsaceus JB14 TaxID=1447944 RepID=A0A6A4GWQ4_9AGAR|nr:hypothetical protein BT96DRAFT_1002920 [Gymnopus androsaceus JB14]